MRVAGLLLAAGLSRRFGPGDKLAAPLDGVALGLHAARALAEAGCAPLVAVTGTAAPDYAALGFAVHANPAPEAGQAGSLAIGVAAARAAGAEAVLVALADMPRVSAAHLRAVIAAGHGADARVASVTGALASPPALFGRDWFDALEGLGGDRGARALLDGAVRVAAPFAMLADVDTPDDLARLNGGDAR